MTRPSLARWLVYASLLAGAIVVIALPVTRAPAFHQYADQRTWLGMPHAGDVLSNLAFIIAGMWFRRRAQTPLSQAACAGVIAIGGGSAAYHYAPSDALLALDWGPIAITLSIVTAAVIEDRLGKQAGRTAFALGPLIAIGSVVLWLATGGTHGGMVTPYGVVQALGIALPPLVALAAPGSIPRVPLLVGVLFFALARLCAANDQQLLDAVGISGHSLKHVAAAIASAFALGALTSRASRASLSSS